MGISVTTRSFPEVWRAVRSTGPLSVRERCVLVISLTPLSVRVMWLLVGWEPSISRLVVFFRVLSVRGKVEAHIWLLGLLFLGLWAMLRLVRDLWRLVF